ncbi:MAG: hypothetical protein ACSW8A_00535 [Lachnospiraceae bacterium]
MNKRKNGLMHRSADGSVTVEASLSVFLFLAFFICLMSFYFLLDLEIRMQSALEDTADLQASYAVVVMGGEDGEGMFTGVMCALDYPAAKLSLVNQLGSSYIKKSWIKGGVGGISLLKSRYLVGGDRIEVIANYKVNLPYLAGVSIPIEQRAERRVWLGDKSSGESEEEEEEEEDDMIVYVTPTGVAYHLYPNCSYIKVKLTAVDAGKISSMRNSGGAKYYPCESCKPGTAGTVYIAEYGTRYHSSSSCKAIEKNPEAIHLSEVGSRHLCQRCAQKAGNGG